MADRALPTDPGPGRALPFAVTAQTTSLDSPFPPIADYGLLSDCHTGALLASDGSIEWMCLPALQAARPHPGAPVAGADRPGANRTRASGRRGASLATTCPRS